MTCIAALETPRGVWVAWDSCLSDGDGGEDRHGGKVWTAPGPMAIGAAGDAAPTQRLMHAEAPAPPVVGELERWASAVIPPWLEEHNATGTPLLLAVRGCVLSVDESGFVWRSEHGYAAIGSGAPYALGALAATSGDPRHRVESAVRAACRHSVSCAIPVLSAWIEQMGAPWDVTTH